MSEVEAETLFVGLVAELELRIPTPNAARRGIQALASSRPGAWLFAHTMHHIDRMLFRVSDGRFTLPGFMAGLPVIMLTTTGARSGIAREVPLVGVPHKGDLAIIGSNFAQPATPGWVYNLEKDPNAKVTVGDRSVRVRARPASADEAERIFERATLIYGGFEAYRRRLTSRSIRVYLLESTSH